MVKVQTNKCVSKTQYPPYGGWQISDLGSRGHLPKGENFSHPEQNFTPCGATVAPRYLLQPKMDRKQT